MRHISATEKLEDYNKTWDSLAYAATTKDWALAARCYWRLHWFFKRQKEQLPTVNID